MAKSDSKRGADRRPMGGNGTRERAAAKAAKAKPGKAAKAVAKPAKRGKTAKGGKNAALNGTALLEAPLATPAPRPEKTTAAAAPAAAAKAATADSAAREAAKGSKKATASKSSKSVPRPSRPAKKKAELLVEQVAAQIVAAEMDRELGGGGGAGENAKPGGTGTAEAEPVEATRTEAAPVETAPSEEASAEDDVSRDEPVRAKGRGKRDDAQNAEDAEREPISTLLRYASVALTGGDPAAVAGQDAIDPASTPGVASREQAEAELKLLAVRLGDLQERLFAAARGGASKRRVLLILQGMDTSGKGGTVRHVVGLLDPNGMRVSSFKAPTEEELAHDFLWRIRLRAPEPGIVGVFDRSQYEDVLIARVRKLALPMVIGRRYLSINKFERELAADGCVVLKCFLHISPEEQKRRLAARLEDPTKHWKYSPTDVDDRALWPQYQDAYRLALEKTSTEQAPWHIVPADRKWYRNYAITRLLVEALEDIDPRYPPGDFDLEVERKRVADS